MRCAHPSQKQKFWRSSERAHAAGVSAFFVFAFAWIGWVCLCFRLCLNLCASVFCGTGIPGLPTVAGGADPDSTRYARSKTRPPLMDILGATAMVAIGFAAVNIKSLSAHQTDI